MRKTLTLILMIISGCFYGQITNSDLKAIKKNLRNEDVIYNIERLKFRFKGIPNSLSSLEIYHLYYGRLFMPIKDIQNPDFKELAKAYYDKNGAESLRLGSKIYHEDPSNLDVLLILLYGYNDSQNMQRFSLHVNQIHTIVNAIKKTGDGKTPNTAFWVNSVGDAQIMMNFLTKGQRYENSIEKIKGDYYTIYNNSQEHIYFKILNPKKL